MSYDKMRKGKKVTDHTRARQCHYCNNFFIKSAEKMQKHLSCCAGKAGFTFSFDNGKNNHRKRSLFDAKMYVVSYCMILAFHPEHTITRLVIFRSYDQNPNPLISLTHF